MILIYILVFAVLLLLSAFFSASETAFFSLSHGDIDRLKAKKDAPTRKAVQLLSNPKKLLISIVIGNTIVNISAASLAAILTLDICNAFGFDTKIGVLIDVVIVTLVILIFTEIVPKITAVKNARRIAVNFSFPLTMFFYLFSPVISLFHLFTEWMTHLFKINKSKILLSEEELLSLVDVGQEKGTLEQDEKEMIHSIFEFSETTVKEIMVPRIDMISISVDADINKLLDVIKINMHSRIPVYQDKVDNIIGIIFAKDLLPYLDKDTPKDFKAQALVRKAYFVPEQKKIDELLREFQTEKIHMAIVVDEYGGTAGLVTLEDIIEEIVGEIQDEHDIEPAMYQKISDLEYLIDGSMDLEELNDEIHLNLPTEEGVETLAGFLFGLFGSVPGEKQEIEYNGYKFVIEKVIRRRIKQVRVFRKPKI